jgi:hypothetical protein
MHGSRGRRMRGFPEAMPRDGRAFDAADSFVWSSMRLTWDDVNWVQVDTHEMNSRPALDEFQMPSGRQSGNYLLPDQSTD